MKKLFGVEKTHKHRIITLFGIKLKLKRKIKSDNGGYPIENFVYSIGENSKFYKTACVNNMRQDKNAVKIGSNTHIRGFLQVYKSCGNIEIGDYCYVGEYSNIWSAKDIKIGNNVLIAHGVDIYDHDTHPLNHLERAQHFRDIITKGHPDNVNWGEKPVIIKDYAWIASKAIILKGVTIGKGAIVAAGSVVVHDVEDFTVVAGNPAKVIKRLKND